MAGRDESIHEILQGLVEPLRTLSAAGLVDSLATTPEMVEQILITDPWECDVCGGVSDVPRCLASSKPHRRRLVCAAHRVLRLVGYIGGRAVMKPAALADRVEGNVRFRPTRRIVQNPQLLLLAYYYSSIAETEGASEFDPVLSGNARLIVRLVAQLQALVEGEPPLPTETRESEARSLLRSLSLAWRRYTRVALASVRTSSQTDADREVCRSELVQGTRDAYTAAWRELRHSQATAASGDGDSKLSDFVELLGLRLERLAGAEALRSLNEYLEATCADGGIVATLAHGPPAHQPPTGLLEAGDSAPPHRGASLESSAGAPDTHPQQRPGSALATTAGRVTGPAAPATLRPSPNLVPAAPPAIYSDNNTSDSEGESLMPPAVASAFVGPSLPPGWHVDETGRSRPPVSQLTPAQQQEQERRQQFARSEYRAKQAFFAALGISPEKTESDRVMSEVTRLLNDAALISLEADINCTPPNLSQVPRMIHLLVEGLLGALPARSRSMVEQEMRDVLDWSVMRHTVMSRPDSIASFAKYAVGKVMAFGAPARIAGLQEQLDEHCKALERGVANSNLGRAVADMFRFILGTIKQLREDVAHYMLLMISGELRENAEAILRDFVSAYLPPVGSWDASRRFIQLFINTEPARRWAVSPAAAHGAVSLTVPERRIRGALLYGTLDLLCSSNRPVASRWDLFPPELFYFEKTEIVRAANVVQEVTLLLLLSGTISMMLRGKGLQRAEDLHAVLSGIQKTAAEALSTPTTLAELKTTISDEVQYLLAGLHPPLSLQEGDIQLLHNTIERMTDTCGPLYGSFEKKAITHLEGRMLDRPSTASGSGEAAGFTSPQPIPKTHELLNTTAENLSRILFFHWVVYKPFYMVMLPMLDLDGTDG